MRVLISAWDDESFDAALKTLNSNQSEIFDRNRDRLYIAAEIDESVLTQLQDAGYQVEEDEQQDIDIQPPSAPSPLGPK